MRLHDACSLAATLCLLAGLGAATPVAAQQPVSVHLELSQQFYYENGPLPVRISVRNDRNSPSPNPIKTKLFKAFKVVRADGTELKLGGKPDAKEPARPDELAPLAFYGALVDLTTLYPELKQVGTYSINWGADGLLSERITVKILPQFDPSKHYEGLIDTIHGQIKITFFAEQSPIAVKAFIDMANAGFYDGLQIHEVRPDTLIAGGNPALGPPRQKPFVYPMEISGLPLVAGTVVMKPVGAAPPANGSEFMILLRPQQSWAGQVTALGSVVSGLDVVRQISQLPHSGEIQRPFFRPKKELLIQKVTIRELTVPSGASSGK